MFRNFVFKFARPDFRFFPNFTFYFFLENEDPLPTMLFFVKSIGLLRHYRVAFFVTLRIAWFSRKLLKSWYSLFFQSQSQRSNLGFSRIIQNYPGLAYFGDGKIKKLATSEVFSDPTKQSIIRSKKYKNFELFESMY